MQTRSRFYLYDFKLFINAVLIPNYQNCRVQLIWKSPRCLKIYNQGPYLLENSEVKIQTEIQLEEVLVKEDLDGSFLSLESEIIIEKIEQNGNTEFLASLKIDLHDLALSDDFHVIKALMMHSDVAQNAEIGIGISQISNIEISQQEAKAFGYSNNLFELLQSGTGNRQNQEKLLEEKKSNNKKAKRRLKILSNYQTMMKIVQGKDMIITEYQQKTISLIQSLRLIKAKLKQIQAQKSIQSQNEIFSQIEPLQLKTDRSNQKKVSVKDLSVRNVSVLVKQSMLKQKQSQLSSRRSKILITQQFETRMKETIEALEALQAENAVLKQKNKLAEGNSQELKQAKNQLYETKKRGILLSQQNELLKKSIADLQMKTLHRLQTQKSQGRMVTCASVDQQQMKLESELWKVRQKSLLEQIERLRAKIKQIDIGFFNLKREKVIIQKDSSFKSNDVQDLIKIKMVQMSNKYAATQQQFRSQIFNLGVQINQLNQSNKSLERENQSNIKKYDHIKQLYDKMKETGYENQKKLLTLNRLQNKNKQLDDFNKKLQATIQKQQSDLREKHKQLLEFSYSRNLTRQKSLTESTDLKIDKRRSFIPGYTNNYKRTELRQSIRELQSVIKQQKDKLDQALFRQEPDSAQKHQKSLKNLQQKVKSQINQLNNLQQEADTSLTRQDLVSRMQLQQIIQQNNQLKNHIRKLMKKIITFETITPPNKLELEIKQRQIGQNQKKLLQNIDDIRLEIQDQKQITKQFVLDSITRIKKQYSDHMIILQEQLKKIIQHEAYLMNLEASLTKKQIKLNIVQQFSSNKRLSSILPDNKWKQNDLLQFSEMKKKQKQMKIKINSLESKALSDKMEHQKQKSDLLKKQKQEQKKIVIETKQAGQKQVLHWKGQMAELQKKMRQKDIEIKQLKHTIEMNKATMENEQRMKAMKMSEHNLKTDNLSHSLQEVTQQLKNQIVKNQYSMDTIKQLNSNINKLTSMIQNKQLDLDHIQQQFKDFKEQSQDFINQLQDKYSQMLEKSNQQKNILLIQIQRLKALVEDEVIKSVKFEDQYKIICQTIIGFEKEVDELNMRLEQKDQVIEQMNQQYDIKLQQIKIMEEEYNKLLTAIEQEGNKYAALKGQHTTLEMRMETAENFIKEIEEQKMNERITYEETLGQYDKQKRAYINEINAMITAHGEKEMEYKKSIQQFELDGNRIRKQLEEQTQKSKKLEQNCEYIARERDQYKNQYLYLLDENQRVNKKDKKKKKPGMAIEIPGERYNMPIGSKNDLQKQLSCVGSGVEGHKSSSIQYDHKHQIHYEQPYTPYTPQSVNDKMIPNLEEASQQFILPSQKSNRAFTFDPPPQLKVTDQNGQEIVSQIPFSRANSFSTKNKFFSKAQPLQEVYQQSIEKHSQKFSKQYQKDRNSDDEQEQEQKTLRQQMANLHKTLDLLTQQLVQKKNLIIQLEAINKKNQVQMNETKKYLQMSIKRKTTLKRSLKDIEPTTPAQHPKQKEAQVQLIPQSLKQMQLLGQKLDSMQQQLYQSKQINMRYEDEIKQMGEQLIAQQAQYEKLTTIIINLEQQINTYEAKQTELYQQIQKLLDEIKIKSGLVAQFEDIIRVKQEQKNHTEQVIEQLQGEIQQGNGFRYRLQTGLEETAEQLLLREKELEQQKMARQQLAKTVQQLSGQLFQAKQELDGKNASLTQYQAMICQHQQTIAELQTNIEDMAEKYMMMQEHINKNKNELEEFSRRLTDKNQKHDDALKRLVNLERQKGLVQLKVKQMQNQLTFKQKVLSDKQQQIKQLEGTLVKQSNTHEIEKSNIAKIIRELQDELKSRELNIELLKKDIEILLNDNQKLKFEQNKNEEEAQVSQQQIKSLISSFEIQLQAEKNKVIVAEQQIKTLKKAIDERTNEIEELNQMEKLRGSLMDQVERSNKETIKKLEGELRIINEQIQKRIELESEEMRLQYEQKLALKDQQYNRLKLVHTRQMKNIEEQRSDMFSKKCELEQTRISMAERQEDYRSKIQKYQGSIKQICGKLKNIETERPHIELFQEVTFQNEIFRNRINELEQIVSFKQRINNQYYIEQLEQIKARFMKQRQQYLTQLQNYSAQVSDLEQKNYQLSAQIQQMRYDGYNDLREENQQLQKSITRLETNEEQLRRELHLLKVKREEQYKQYLSELRALKSK